jgi:hypothetical protein
MYLTASIDDATSRLFARFVPADAIEHHMRVLWAYTERYGRPEAVYTDRAGLFQPVLPPGWKEEESGAKDRDATGACLPGTGYRVDCSVFTAGEGTG